MKKKNEDRKNLVFPHVYLVGGIENYFIWLERKLSKDGKYNLYKLTHMSLLKK